MKIFKWEKVSESDRNFAFKELCINLLGPIVICILCFALIYTVISEISLLEDVGSSSFIKEKSGKVFLLFFLFPFSLFFLKFWNEFSYIYFFIFHLSVIAEDSI